VVTLSHGQREAVVYAPLVVQALIAAVGDWLTFRVAHDWFGQPAARWALVVNLTSWAVM
jgi:hypothetical protein